ncbi:MFS transporter [Streptomyces sp. NPDC002928]|uniref:MFS transporter n=1 Tax=Streptomyces sp. NPDC002928 TaxID=3154440 RepID=UPI0033BE5022
MTHTPRPPAARGTAKAVFASWIGTTIEYYDFAVYGLAASLVFADLFFPATNPVIGTLLSLSSFAIGYVARPLGAIVFGHFGDRVGRKTTLVVTLVLMGAATFLIGLLPDYGTIGVAAPVLLVVARLLQGFSVGGEYGGAVLMTVEHSGQHRRGLLGSLVNTGATAGLLLANAVFLLVLQLPDDQMQAWGWRIPFLLSGALVVVGLIARLALEETPDFAEAREDGAVRRRPIVDVLQGHLGSVFLVAFGILASGTAFTMVSVYSLTYEKTHLGLGRDETLTLLLPAVAVVLVALPLFGRLADRLGVRRVFLAGALSLMVLPFVWFPLLDTRSYLPMLIGHVLILVGYAANYATVPAFFSQAFPPAVRFTGMSLGFTVGLIASNAIAPAVATSIMDATGSWTTIALYMAGVSLLSVVAGCLLREAGATPPDQAPDAAPSPATALTTEA